MKYLVTGCAGFIGSHIVEALLKRGDEVRGLDNFSTGHFDNIKAFAKDFEFIEGDIRDSEICSRVCHSVDHIIHQAALGSVPRSIEDPATTHENNTTGTLNMLIAARDADVQSFVFAASSSAYGDTTTLPKHEDMPKRPLSPYAITKAMCEEYCATFANLYQLNTVALRYFNIFGPRQSPDGPYAAVIPRFIEALFNGVAPVIYGDGEQTRDFTYVANAVSANIKATEHAERARGHVMNIACGERISLNQLYQFMAKEIGVELEMSYKAKRPGDVRDSLASIDKAYKLIGYKPLVRHAEGLVRTIAYWRDYYSSTPKFKKAV